MEATKNLRKNGNSGEKLYKFFIYFVLIVLAITIIVPVAWVFMASIKAEQRVLRQPLVAARGLLLAELRGRLDQGQHG